MKKTAPSSFLFITAFLIILFKSATALATQTHGEPEGLYVHQMAHIFFIISMGILEFWLRQRNLIKEPGWKYIQLAAVFLILWNLNAFMVHFLDEQVNILQIDKINLWHIRITAAEGYGKLVYIYYLGKLDHLLCVPAMICLYLGLKRLLKDTETA